MTVIIHFQQCFKFSKSLLGQPITEEGRTFTLPGLVGAVVAPGQCWQLLSGTQRQEPQSCGQGQGSCAQWSPRGALSPTHLIV